MLGILFIRAGSLYLNLTFDLQRISKLLPFLLFICWIWVTCVCILNGENLQWSLCLSLQTHTLIFMALKSFQMPKITRKVMFCFFQLLQTTALHVLVKQNVLLYFHNLLLITNEMPWIPLSLVFLPHCLIIVNNVFNLLGSSRSQNKSGSGTCQFIQVSQQTLLFNFHPDLHNLPLLLLNKIILITSWLL